MRIKNIGHKIVNVGATAIMPDDEVQFNGTLAANPSLRAMANRGYIEIIADTTDAADVAKEAETKAVVDATKPTNEDLLFEQTTEFTAAPSPTAATTIRGKKIKAKQDEEANATSGN